MARLDVRLDPFVGGWSAAQAVEHLGQRVLTLPGILLSVGRFFGGWLGGCGLSSPPRAAEPIAPEAAAGTANAATRPALGV